MRKTSTRGLLSFALCSACLLYATGPGYGGPADPPAKEGKSFTSDKGGFSVTLPPGASAAKEKEQTSGTAKVITVASQLPDRTALNVTVARFPADALKGATDEDRLKRVRDGLARSFRGKITSDKEVKLDGNPGRDLGIEVVGGTLSRVRVYMVKDRLIQIMVLGPKTTVNSKEADQFLDSFKLTDK